MNCDSFSTRGLARFRSARVLAFALVLGLGIASFHDSASAGVNGAGLATGPSALATDARSGSVIIVAENKNWNQGGNKNWNQGGGNKNWNKDWSNNNNNNWNKDGNKNWNNNNNNNNNWGKNYNRSWGKGWSNYNNHWNKNWNNRAYVRGWSQRPYYGDFVGGIVLGSILAATGVGVVPYAPEPYLCWYWADPYMYRGYWDYCY
jgi:hypothetical protein